MAIATVQTGLTAARLVRLLMAIALLAALIALPTPVKATTFVVDDDGLQCPGAPFTTIQAAVNAAGNGDTIQVCPGTYPEPAPGPLTINKILNVLGAQAGVDARGVRGPESVITDTQGTTVTASSVVIDGFTVQNSTHPFVNGGFGILMAPGITGINGTQVLNNIVQNNIIGIGLANAGGRPAVIRHNLIQNNNAPGAATGSGIYTDQFVSGGAVRDVLVQENTFSRNSVAALNISNTDPVNGVFNLDVDTNSFDGNGRGVLFFSVHNSTIQDNSITNSTLTAISLVDFVTNLDILRNDLRFGASDAIRLTEAGFVAGLSSGLEIHQNNIEVFVGNGLTVGPMSHVGTVNAECNWWNSPSGPFNATSNPTGTGEEVVGDADFTPWLIARAPGGACIGGVPSTPGKVTGGGQIGDQDPLFSPLGDLLTLPAIIVSTSGGGEASFGFVISFAEGDTAPKGNLVYQDRSADVRIKATSYDQLVIEDGICGPNSHATFTGMADVNGDPESLTVVVDDCGEPSTGLMPDTFSISTDSYSNGGPLIGGNIQIH